MNHNTRTNDRKNRQNKYEFFMFKKVLYVAPNIFHGVPPTKATPALCFARIAKAILGGITPRCEVK